MCGFYAELATGRSVLEGWSGSSERVLGALAHRGPDASGAFNESTGESAVRLVHARLKVRDLSELAAQPMMSADGLGRLVYNGELYDFEDVAAQLRQAGVSFRSTSDTEVLLEALRRWGIGALERVHGMFALAWWDAPSRSLWLARDRLGIKPLYWCRSGSRVAAASEVRALLAGRVVEPKVEPSGIASYFAYGSVWGAATAIAGVEALAPGCWMRISSKGIETDRYWRPRFTRPAGLRRGDALEQVRGLLGRAVRSQLAADVPVGVFLSGGIDSRAILSCASRAAGERIKAYTIAFTGDAGGLDERQGAAEAARSAGAAHEIIELSASDCVSDLPDIAAAADLPSIDGVNSWFVSKAVRAAGIVVALSGLGGDEVFAGYPHLRHAKLFGALTGLCGRAPAFAGSRAGWAASVKRRKLAMALRSAGTPRGLYATRRSLFQLPGDEDLFETALAERWIARQDAFLTDALERFSDPLEEQTALELQNYMSDTLLRDTDCMSMAHALEVRVPLLDERLVEFVLSLPPGWRVRRGLQKPLLCEAAGLQPVAPSSKRGFTLPFVQWLRGPLAGLVGECIERLPRAGEFVRAPAARELWQRFRAGEDHLWTRVWSIFVLDRWLESIHTRPQERRIGIVERRQGIA